MNGYIVFEDGGTSPITYGASEKWFPSYDDATQYAMDVVANRVKESKWLTDCNSVVVYEGENDLMHRSHSVPCGRVVFNWSNWKK